MLFHSNVINQFISEQLSKLLLQNKKICIIYVTEGNHNTSLKLALLRDTAQTWLRDVTRCCFPGVACENRLELTLNQVLTSLLISLRIVHYHLFLFRFQLEYSKLDILILKNRQATDLVDKFRYQNCSEFFYFAHNQVGYSNYNWLNRISMFWSHLNVSNTRLLRVFFLSYNQIRYLHVHL